MSRAGDLGDYGTETNLWVAVISKGIKDATRKVPEPDLAHGWSFILSRNRKHRLDEGREFFSNGSCLDILTAIDVDQAWFMGKLRLRHPGIFESAKEGEHDRDPDN